MPRSCSWILAHPEYLDPTIPPPNPMYIAIHAAFAKVLHLSAAAEYVDALFRDDEELGPVKSNDEVDLFGDSLKTRLEMVTVIEAHAS